MPGVVARQGLVTQFCVNVLARSEYGDALTVRVPTKPYNSLRRRVLEAWDDSVRRDVRVLVATARGDPLHLAAGDLVILMVPTERGEKIETELRITALRMLCDRYSGVAHRAIVTATW